MRLQLLGVLADIFVLLDLARCVELVAAAAHCPLIDPQHPRDLVVVELGNLQKSREDGSVVVG